MHFSYQAVDNTTGTVHVWTSALPDPEGAGYPGPNSPTCILQTNNPLEDLVVPETLEYPTLEAARLGGALADGTFCRIVEGCKEFRYSATSGAGWEDDGDTILRPVYVELGENGRFFSTRASEHAATFAAFRAMKGLLGRAKHVHVESHTTFGDGGGGIFDIKPVGSYVDNNGTVLVNGTAAGVRRGSENGPVHASWFGVRYDATASGTGTDSTDALFGALACANGLSDGNAFENGAGDASFEDTGRRNRPVLVAGPCRVTRRIPVRWRGVQIIGDLVGTDTQQLKSSCIFLDHDDHGIYVDTGVDPVGLAPSLALCNLAIIRCVSHRAACLDGVHIEGHNWFMGLKISNCTISHNQNNLKLSANYFTGGARIISNIVLNDRSYFSHGRERGIDIEAYCQLSDIRNISCWKNILGGFRIWADASTVESIDIEGGGDANVLSLLGGRAGSYYTEATLPGTKGFVNLLSCKKATIEGLSTNVTNKIGYRVTGGVSNRITDRLPIRPLGCSDTESASGIYPPQDATDDTAAVSMSHNITLCRYLESQPAVSPSVLTDVALVAYAPLYAANAYFDGVRLPAQVCGTVGSPTHALSTGSVARACTAGKIYMFSYAIKYAHRPVNNPSLYHGCYVRLDESGTMQTPCVAAFGASRLDSGDTVQVIGFFVPTANATTCKVYIFPYGDPFAGNADYGASVSEVYTAEVTAGEAFPLIHVPTLLRGAPFVGSVALNGATPVTLADAGVRVTSSVRTERTTIGGTMGAYNIAWAAGVGYTLTGTAGDTSTITVSRDC